ncbi:MAG: hypothetical protein V2G42_01135 [bacterium JZ-2024 1]
MNPRVLIYGALLAGVVVAGIFVRSAARKNHGQYDEGLPGLAGGIFVFSYLEPYFPSGESAMPSVSGEPSIQGDWNSLSSENQFVIFINDAGPFDTYTWVDGVSIKGSTHSEFSFPYLRITFPELLLSPGERNVIIWFIRDKDNWGYVKTKIQVKSPQCEAYRQTIVEETNRMFRIEHREGGLRKALEAFQNYLLLPCRYGTMNVRALAGEIEAVTAIWDAQGDEFWEIVAGKPLKKVEARLALKVFQKNWKVILSELPADRPNVSPFLRPDIAELAAQIVTVLKERQNSSRASNQR